MTTLSQPNPIPPSETLAALPQIPRDEVGPVFVGPVFAEPWRAHAFALAVNLSELGYFAWKEWAAALERLVTFKGLSDPARAKKPGPTRTAARHLASPSN